MMLKLEKACSYLDDLNQEFTVTVKPYCANPIVNAVLSSKEQLAIDEGIACKIQVDLAEMPEIEDIDLCALLANTLDNAIEACRKVPEASARFLDVKARCTGGFFSYKVVNARRNDVVVEKGDFVTSKKDASHHGIGLKNVRQIVEKYHGYIEITYIDGSFSVVIMV